MLRVENLTYKYHNKDSNIFQNLCFNFPKHNLIHLSGPNGIGKSTLFYCLSGFICSYLGGDLTGEIFIQEKPLDSFSTKDRISHINQLFQDPEVQISFSRVHEDVFFLLKQTERMKEDSLLHFQELQEMFKISFDKNTLTNQLSWGQKKIICIIALLLNNPLIYLLDEPFAGLSLKDRATLRNLLYKKREEGRLIIISDHSQYELDYNSEFSLESYAGNR